MPLGIHVDKQHIPIFSRKARGEVYGGCGFTTPSFVIGNSYDSHFFLLSDDMKEPIIAGIDVGNPPPRIGNFPSGVR
jgi:hypothetical protein